jgi:hypothetical protein
VVIGAQEALLEYGGRTNLAGYAVLHLGNDSQEGGCVDGSSSAAGIAVVRGSLEQWAALDRGACGDTTCAPGDYCQLPGTAACRREHAQALCSAAPASCELECPGVCGCDGRFYCNACRAAQAGVDVAPADTSCMAAGCRDDAVGSEPGAPACVFTWPCFGQNYQIRCGQDGDAVRCACIIDAQVTARVERAPGIECEALAAACGFPPFGRP